MSDVLAPVRLAVLERDAWVRRLRDELEQRILPYWRNQMLDPRGGIYGGRDNDGTLRNDLPRSAVLGTRVLWTFATAARLMPHPAWRTATDHAWDWFLHTLWDKEHGGVFWSVDADGSPLAPHKQSYAQGFAIYACAAYYRLTGSNQALSLAQQCFALLDAAYDLHYGGYFEGCTRDWKVLEDARLSDKEPQAPKSMNTLLHLLEGFTELYAVCPEPKLEARLRELVKLFLMHIWQEDSDSFSLFFSRKWQKLSKNISWGHDIETGWLLRRAAKVLGDDGLHRRTSDLGLRVADAVLLRGVAADGSIMYEGDVRGVINSERHWWCQAEAMVSFQDVFEQHGDPRHRQAAEACWKYIERHHIDRNGRDWFKVLDAEGRPLPGRLRAGPWECPYHHARACFEMIGRLEHGRSKP